MQSHKDHSFVAMRHLRRLEIEDSWLLAEVIQQVMICLDHPGDFLEWTEFDEVLAARLSTYIQRTNGGWDSEALYR